MNICIYGASSDIIDKSYITAGENLGKSIAEHNHTIVYGGGAEGMMGAVARGVSSLDGKIIGIAPSFFNVDGILYKGCTEFLYTETMRERKELMENKSDAFLVTPGGIGTFDEFFEIFTLRQLCRHLKPIAIYNINGYFDLLEKMLTQAIEQNFMPETNRKLYCISSDPEVILNYIENYKCDKAEPDIFKHIK